MPPSISSSMASPARGEAGIGRHGEKEADGDGEAGEVEHDPAPKLGWRFIYAGADKRSIWIAGRRDKEGIRSPARSCGTGARPPAGRRAYGPFDGLRNNTALGKTRLAIEAEAGRVGGAVAREAAVAGVGAVPEARRHGGGRGLR